MKNVIILGGGFAGALASKKLEDKFHVTLIDTKDYFEFTPSVLRTLVEPHHIRKIQVLHSHYLRHTHIMQGEVRTIRKNQVIVHSWKGLKKVSFDYLIVATGSRYSSPIKEKNLVITSRAEELRTHCKRLRDATTVLIIGGGLAGVELAAEIATAYPIKKVTIIHAHDRLIERNPLQASRYAYEFLRNKGVSIALQEKVTRHRNHTYITDKSTSFQADIAFLCTGIMPNHEHLGECATSLNPRNFLCVNEYLQVQGHDHIFAAGDIADTGEEKTAQNAEKHACLVAENICRLEKGKPMLPYHPTPRPMVISLGKWDGLLVYRNLVISGILPGILKRCIEWKTMRHYR